MITRLELRNFQRHRRLSLELSPTVTTIVGPTNAGKSAVLRALRWLALNKPTGDRFLSYGSKLARVSLEVDGHRVERLRGSGGRNTYRVDGKTLRAFGVEPPAEVSRLLRLQELNFQRQVGRRGQGRGDPLFWFALTPAEVSRDLNEVVDLGAVDRLLANLAKRQRAAVAEGRVVEQRLSAARSERRRLLPAERAHRDLSSLDGRAEAARVTLEGSRTLGGLVERALGLRNALGRGNTLGALGDAASAAGEVATGTAARVSELRRLLEGASGAAPRAHTPVPTPPEDPAAGARARRVRALRGLLREARELGAKVSLEGARAQRLEGEFHRESRGQACPLCGRARDPRRRR